MTISLEFSIVFTLMHCLLICKDVYFPLSTTQFIRVSTTGCIALFIRHAIKWSFNFIATKAMDPILKKSHWKLHLRRIFLKLQLKNVSTLHISSNLNSIIFFWESINRWKYACIFLWYVSKVYTNLQAEKFKTVLFQATPFTFQFSVWV